MPRAPRHCGFDGCRTPVTGRAYCDEHRRPFAGSTRNTHGRPWRERKAEVLARDGGVCANCQGPGTHADHIVPKAMGGTDALDNLQTLCAPCHYRKTARDANEARWGVKE